MNKTPGDWSFLAERTEKGIPVGLATLSCMSGSAVDWLVVDRLSRDRIVSRTTLSVVNCKPASAARLVINRTPS